MSRHSVTLTLRPPTWIQRLWYRKLRIPAPLSVSAPRQWHADWARLLPYRWRSLHRAYAQRHGFFWLPCVLCDKPFGGHESGDVVPDPTSESGAHQMICSRCTRAGRGWVARHPIEDALDEIHDRHEHGHGEYILDCSACAACCAEVKAFVADYNRRGRS